MLGSAVQGLVGQGAAAKGETTPALLELLGSQDGSEAAGFSGELQALLMQLSPQVLQQLDERIQGGMSLPEAARSLLADAAEGGPAQPFASLLRERLPERIEKVAEERPLALVGEAREALNVLAGAVARGPVADPGAAPAAAMVGGPTAAPVAATGLQVSANVPMPGQLTSNLLDMVVPQAVGGRGWDGAIGERVLWMVQGEHQVAKLKLNPPNLGPLEVRVSVNHDQTSVSFVAQHASVREALEAALPRLREMFDQQSLNLVRADVSDPGAQGQERATDAQGRGGYTGPGDNDDEIPGGADGAVATAVRIGAGLVDLFA